VSSKRERALGFVVNLVCTILQSLLCSLHAGKDCCELSSELHIDLNSVNHFRNSIGNFCEEEEEEEKV